MNQFRMKLLALAFLAIGLLLVNVTLGQDKREIDFKYPPLDWQTAICLPDDPYKSLVAKDGGLIYYKVESWDYQNPYNEIHLKVTEGAEITQRLHSPKVPIVITTTKDGDFEIIEESFAVTEIPQKIVNSATPLSIDPDLKNSQNADMPRNDVMYFTIRNTTSGSKNFTPVVWAESYGTLEQKGDRLVMEGHDEVAFSLKPQDFVITQDDKRAKATVTFEAVTIEAGDSFNFAVMNYGGGKLAAYPTNLKEVENAKKQNIKYWNNYDLPYGRITIPDKGIQNLIDASIRNIWQAREIKNGLPAFQVGPSVYRALYIVDGAFMLETATMLGAGDQARAGIDYMLSFQKEDGRFEILNYYHKENGIVIWATIRQALLKQDKEWLLSKWDQLGRAAEYIKTLRAKTLENESPLDDGLIPPGFADGGIGWTGTTQKPYYEYSNVLWNLVGLRAYIDAARWLGKDAEAEEWQEEYDDFYATFRKAAERDLQVDFYGNEYLHILMVFEDEMLKTYPEWATANKAQWAFCHAVYPGQIFEKDDPLIAGNLAMLETYEKEGMVLNTGWLTDGIWNYFSSFYGHAWLWQGDAAKAIDQLYAMGNHATPLYVWREEQYPQGEGEKIFGDMPHNWASAEFIRLATHLLALDRGNEMHLLEGMPKEWLEKGMKTALNGVTTPFGELEFELEVDASGESAELNIKPLPSASCESIVVHLGEWGTYEGENLVRLNPSETHRLTISLK